MRILCPLFGAEYFFELKNEVLTLSVLKDIIKLYYKEDDQYEKKFD